MRSSTATALLCCLLSLSLLPAAMCATRYPGRCEVVEASHVQAVDSSSACRAAADWAASNPLLHNPYDATAYFGAQGHVAGVTRTGGAACCQGHAGTCVGNCPCSSNVLHCSGYRRNGTSSTCIVSECEVPPVYSWISEQQEQRQLLLIVLLCVGLPAALLLLARLTERCVKASRARQAQAGLQQQQLVDASSAGADHSYVQLNR